MKTKKSIATISYNTLGFLTSTCNSLLKSGYIDSWSFIPHLREEDEKKEHIHLFLEPAKSLDTSWLITEFFEPVENNNIPLGVLPFRPSKFEDWYYYNLHDPTYLETKNLFRKYHYSFNDMYFSNVDYYLELVREIDCSKWVSSKRFIQAVEDGFTFAELVKMGIVPLQSVISYNRAYEILLNEKKSKNIDKNA